MKLSELSLSRIDGDENVTLAASVSENTYALDPNPRAIKQVDFSFEGKDKALTLKWETTSATIPLGSGEHKKGIVIMPLLGQQPVASSGGWISENSYQARIYLYETPYFFNYLFTFDDDELVMDGGINVSFGGSDPEPVRGRIMVNEEVN